MGNVVIKIEEIAKAFEVGSLGASTFKQDLLAWVDGLTNKKNPRTKKDLFWALKDISFEVEEGEVVGVIGPNGSGKSTLMKILSRIILPTQGVIRGKGRISSLLEVGTGFHGELTGRENVFLNGQILGMKRHEISAKFDEIVAFSGVEAFLETPVKRYSSGMYVRLAFAVAAHLETEIMIIDEVLAVGDLEFQRKCMAKMKELASQKGKTVLVISHDMQALRKLCTKAVYLEKGRMTDIGDPLKVMANYLWSEKIDFLSQQYDDAYSAPGNHYIRVKRVELTPSEKKEGLIYASASLRFDIDFWSLHTPLELSVRVFAFNFAGECLFEVSSPLKNITTQALTQLSCEFPSNFFNAGSYYFSVYFITKFETLLFGFDTCLSVDLSKDEAISFNTVIPKGYIAPTVNMYFNE